MNPLESELDYPMGDTLPAGGARLEVVPGVFWLRMPLPFALDHINLWLIRDDFDGQPGWTLVDCGVSNDVIQGHWETIFAGQLDGLPIRRILVTHAHPDHVGLAWWIQQRFGAPLWMTLGEYAMGRVMSQVLPGTNSDSAAEHFRRNGMPPGPQIDAIRNRNVRYFPSLVPAMPLAFRRIRDHEWLSIGGHRWRVITGVGHSSEHAALYCDGLGVLISGDMVLPRISTNVSVFEVEPDSNPVEWFIESLARFADCRGDTLVLPSHGRPFRHLHRRLQQLRDHHAERLEMVLKACQLAPRTGYDIVPLMFLREFDTHQMTFAMGEALAHLHALWYRGLVTRVADDRGVFRFRAPAQAL